jgi:hypothetical protein
MDWTAAIGWTAIALVSFVFTWTTTAQRRQAWVRVCAAARACHTRSPQVSETDLAIAEALAGNDLEDDLEYERQVEEALSLSVKQNTSEELRRRRSKQRAETEKQTAEKQQEQRDRAIPALRKIRQATKSAKKDLPPPQRSKYEDKLQSGIHKLCDQPMVLKLLLTIVEAVQSHPDEPKYRRLSLQNNRFKEQLTGDGGRPSTAANAVGVLRLLGFKLVGQTQMVLNQISVEHLSFGCRCLVLQLTLHASMTAYTSHFARKDLGSKIPREPSTGAAGTTKVTIWIEILSVMKQTAMQTNAPALDAVSLAAVKDGGVWRRRVGDEMEGEGGAVNVAAGIGSGVHTAVADTGSSGDGKLLVTGRAGCVKFVRHFDSDCMLGVVMAYISSLQLADM